MALKIFTSLMTAGLLWWSLPGLAETLAVSGDAIQVEDGDTLLITFPDGVRRVQLSGIDAPEDKENPKFAVDLKRTALAKDTLLELGATATGHLATEGATIPTRPPSHTRRAARSRKYLDTSSWAAPERASECGKSTPFRSTWAKVLVRAWYAAYSLSSPG